MANGAYAYPPPPANGIIYPQGPPPGYSYPMPPSGRGWNKCCCSGITYSCTQLNLFAAACIYLFFPSAQVGSTQPPRRSMLLRAMFLHLLILLLWASSHHMTQTCPPLQQVSLSGTDKGEG